MPDGSRGRASRPNLGAGEAVTPRNATDKLHLRSTQRSVLDAVLILCSPLLLPNAIER
jgi:hypothetical protein